MADADTPKRGRPPGEETPESLIRRELIKHIKVYTRTREIIEKHLNDRGESMTPDEVAKYMDILRKGVVDLAKPIVAPAKAETAPKDSGEENVEVILRGLLG